MDAWTVFGAVKLFLDIIEGGPRAAIKGILMSGVPYSDLLDVGEVVFGLFGLDGRYRGTVVLREEQRVPLSTVELLGKERLTTALAQRDFPTLARRQFAAIEKQRFQKREFPKF
jgi:hypothetical protein